MRYLPVKKKAIAHLFKIIGFAQAKKINEGGDRPTVQHITHGPSAKKT